MDKDLEKLYWQWYIMHKQLQETKFENKFKKDSMKGDTVEILKVWRDADPAGVIKEFHDGYLSKMNHKQTIAFLQAHIHLLIELKEIEKEIDQNEEKS